MKWPTIREQYPNNWVLVEALNAMSLSDKRIIEEMSVISNFPDSRQAWKDYKSKHLTNPERELYIFFTGNESIEVHEQSFMGYRSNE